MAKPASVEAYLAELPAPSRAAMEQLRATIRATAPTATEGISYNIPEFRVGGRGLISYAAFTNHVSLFPASGMVVQALGAAVTERLSGKATLRLRLDEPLPLDLVTKVVQVRLEEVAARGRL